MRDRVRKTETEIERMRDRTTFRKGHIVTELLKRQKEKDNMREK